MWLLYGSQHLCDYYMMTNVYVIIIWQSVLCDSYMTVSVYVILIWKPVFMCLLYGTQCLCDYHMTASVYESWCYIYVDALLGWIAILCWIYYARHLIDYRW